MDLPKANGPLWPWQEKDIEQDNTDTNIAAQLAQIATNVRLFGAKGDNVTDDSTAFQNAINAAATNGIKKVIARGTFYINSVINLASDIDYDFKGATFIPGPAVASYLFLGTNISNVNVKAGSYKIDGRSATTTLPTGTYSAFAAFQFNQCSNVHVERSNFYNLWTCINFYDCTDCDIDRCFTKDCNASFAGVATNQVMRNISINHNIIKSGGDDGIAFLVNGSYNIEECQACFNQIDKVTRSDGKLDGSTIAAVGVRLSIQSGGVTGRNKFIAVKGNQFKDMVQQAIYVSQADHCNISDNTINGFEKNGSSSEAITIGTATTEIITDMIISKNIITGAYHDSHGMKIQGVSKSIITGNEMRGFGIAGEGVLFLNSAANNIVKDNIVENSKAYAIQLYDNNCPNNTFEGNDVSVFVAYPINLNTANTGTILGKNRGLPTNGSATIGSGTTSVTISHLLYGIPTTITLTPQGNIGAVWVSNVTSTQFTINCATAPGANIQVSWKAEY